MFCFPLLVVLSTQIEPLAVPVQTVDFGGPRGFVMAVHKAMMRAGLDDVSSRILTAHSVVSTNWGRGVHNFNFSGMKARRGKPFAVRRSCECRVGYLNRRASKYKCSDGKGQKCWSMRWRAYATLDEGVRAFLSAVRLRRYRRAYELLLLWDTEYFAEVGRAGWYSADPERVKLSGERRLRTINRWLGKPKFSLPVALHFWP